MDDALKDNDVEFFHPFLPYYEDKRMVDRLCEELRPLGVGTGRNQSSL